MENVKEKKEPHIMTLYDGTEIDLDRLYPLEKRYPLNFCPMGENEKKDEYYDYLTEKELIKYGLKKV